MESRFKRGDIIAERGFESSMKYLVLDEFRPWEITLYSYNGYTSTLPIDKERHYVKIGHINLRPLLEEIKKGGAI